MSVRQSVETRRPSINQIRQKITDNGHATRTEQHTLLANCVDDKCVGNLLTWLVRDVGMGLQEIILEIKTSGPGQARPEAMRLARQRHAHLKSISGLMQTA